MFSWEKKNIVVIRWFQKDESNVLEWFQKEENKIKPAFLIPIIYYYIIF